MNDITIDISGINFSDPDIAEKIQAAIENKQCFALCREKSMIVFDPVGLCSRSKSKTTYMQQGFQYNDIHSFIQAIQITLSTQSFLQIPTHQ